MRSNRRRRAWVVLAVMAGVLAVPASAAATEYGGGSLSLTSSLDPGLSLVGLRTDGSSLNVRAEALPRCGRGVFDHAAVLLRTTLLTDGTFSRSGTARISSARSVRLDISGSVVGERASGLLTLSTATKIGGRTRSCSTGSIGWQARAAVVQPTGTARPQPGARYYGTTSQINADVPSGFELGVTSDGARVIQTVFAWRHRCTRGSGGDTELAPPINIAADGSFSMLERFTQIRGNVRERFRVDLAGRFAQGGAVGTARVRSTRRNKRTGALISTCDSKTFSWSALL